MCKYESFKAWKLKNRRTEDNIIKDLGIIFRLILNLLEYLNKIRPNLKYFKLFQSLLCRHQIGLKTTMKGSSFIFYHDNLFYYNFNKIKLNWGGLYIDSLDWIKSKIASINPVNENGNKCFQYAAILALNNEEIGRNAEIIKKFKTFYRWI